MKILVATSSLPASDSDQVPAFVQEQAVNLKSRDPGMSIILHAPHNAYSSTWRHLAPNMSYREIRFHYFWPFRWELLSGRGIMPALRHNAWLHVEIPFLVLFQFSSLLRTAIREKPDLLYAHWFTPQAIITALVARLVGRPFIFTTHASDVQVLRGVPLGKTLVRLVCSRAAAYTAVSRRTAAKLIVFFKGALNEQALLRKLTIIPMGVRLDGWDVAPSLLKAIRDRYHVSENLLTVLYLGRLVEKKGVAHLIEALALLTSETKEKLQVVIAGDGQLREALERQVAELGLTRVVFTGYVHGDEKRALYSLADFVCLPSIVDDRGDSEGLPVVLMEALAAGRILLASDISGAEAIITHGESGFLFPQRSSQALASTLEMAAGLDSARKVEIRRRSRELAAQFDWDIVAARYRSLFEAAVHAHSAL